MYALKGSASLLAMLRTRTINILGRDYYERASIKYIHIGGRSLFEASIVLKLSKGGCVNLQTRAEWVQIPKKLCGRSRGTLVLRGSTTEAESSELCAGPGHAGILTADKSSSSNTGTYFPYHTDQFSIIT